MMEILLILIGLLVGSLLGWVLSAAQANSKNQAAKDIAAQKYTALELNYAAYKAMTTTQLASLNESIKVKHNETHELNTLLQEKSDEIFRLMNQTAAVSATMQSCELNLTEKNKDNELLKAELKSVKADLDERNQQLATALANGERLNEKLTQQMADVEKLSAKFNMEFENIANKILETKTEKFTELNKTNLKGILEPLGKNIEEFRKTVNETYDKESKERFSLGEKVKELAQLNQEISKEARNLTNALKSESKTQGVWGEMILESILEKSGLRKDEEYFMEHQLVDKEGNALKSDATDKKMRPDAVIKYPDNRSVIIDSKVSLNAYTRYQAASTAEDQKLELAAHVNSVKNHIIALSTKGYDDYASSLDFVMMFLPTEPAYMAALQGDPDLWNFAYAKRILLINPTNLIISLKLIVDLWKREYQNRNAQEIAERGAKLYDKFVGFVENLKDMGKHIDKAKDTYEQSFKQLSTGNDNLILQANKLKSLGLKAKKNLPEELVRLANADEDV